MVPFVYLYSKYTLIYLCITVHVYVHVHEGIHYTVFDYTYYDGSYTSIK